MPRKGKVAEGVYRRELPISREIAEKSRTRYIVAEDGCWIADGAARSTGYKTVYGLNPETGRTMGALAHRASWVYDHGPIPAGMVVDHMCFNRACINPDHLRLLTQGENVRRSKGIDFPLGQCKWGHDEKHIEWFHYPSRDQRICRLCQEERNARQTAIQTALYSLELAYGLGGHETKKNYPYKMRQRAERVAAVRADMEAHGVLTSSSASTAEKA